MRAGAGVVGVAVATAIALGAFSPAGAAGALPQGWQASNMKPLSHLDLPGPRHFKLSIKQANGRWYLFVAEGGGAADVPLEGRGFHVVDVTDPTNPKRVTTVPVASASGQLTHHDNLLIAGIQNPYEEGNPHPREAPGDLIFMTYFTAGVRAYDISDPNMPKESGWFLPKIGTWESGDRGPEDVLVDTRGNIYISEGHAGGLWVLRYTNPKGPKLPVTAKLAQIPPEHLTIKR